MFDRDKLGRLCQTVITFENGKLVQNQKWEGKETTIEREIQDGKLTAVSLSASNLRLCIFRLHLTFVFLFFFFVSNRNALRMTLWHWGSTSEFDFMFSIFHHANKVWIVIRIFVHLFVLIFWVSCVMSSTTPDLFLQLIPGLAGNGLFQKSCVPRLQSLTCLPLHQNMSWA